MNSATNAGQHPRRPRAERWSELFETLGPLLHRGSGGAGETPGPRPFDASAFFERLVGQLPADRQADVRAALGDLPNRLNQLIAKWPSGGRIQPIAPGQPTPMPRRQAPDFGGQVAEALRKWGATR